MKTSTYLLGCIAALGLTACSATSGADKSADEISKSEMEAVEFEQTEDCNENSPNWPQCKQGGGPTDPVRGSGTNQDP